MVESNTSKDNFLVQHADFSLREQVKYPNGGLSSFYDNGTDMVIIDEDICVHDPEEPVFSYMLITDKQNYYMHRFKRVFRFLGYVQDKLQTWSENRDPYDILVENNRVERLGGWDFLFIAKELFTDQVQVDWGSFAYKCTRKQLQKLVSEMKCKIPKIQELDPDKVYGIVFIEES